jgi:plastocyanin
MRLHMSFSRVLAALGAAVCVCALAALAAADDAMVTIHHGRLDPASVTVPVGGTLHFTNGDAMPGGHSVAADDGSFTSPSLGKGDSWKHSFEKAGRYAYHIVQHPDVKGVVVVEAAPAK